MPAGHRDGARPTSFKLVVHGSAWHEADALVLVCGGATATLDQLRVWREAPLAA